MASRACFAAAVAAGSSRGASAFGAGARSAPGARALSTVAGRRSSLPAAQTASLSGSSHLAFANAGGRMPINSFRLQMSSTEAVEATKATPRRVKTANAAVSEDVVSVKGWVRTVRKQKTLAFVEVNDGSSMSGIQCVLPFDDVDEATMKGAFRSVWIHEMLSCCFSPFMPSPRHMHII